MTQLAKIQIWLLLALMGILLPGMVGATEVPHLRQSIRSNGMGGTGIALADDEYALFTNPAGLATFRRVVTELATVQITTNQSFINWMQTAQQGGDQLAIINAAVNKNMAAEGNVSVLSSISPGFSYSIHGDYRYNYFVQEQAFPFPPVVDASNYEQLGFALGYAQSLVDYTLDVGVSWKAIARNTTIVNDISAVTFVDTAARDALFNAAKTTKVEAVGDVGVIYHLESDYEFQTRIAAVLRNIGGLYYGGIYDMRPSVDLGWASQSEIFGADVLFAVDYLDVTNKLAPRSFWRNTRLGAELGFNKLSNGHHTVAWRYGFRSGYKSYGFSLNIPYVPFQIDFAKWSEEVGTRFGDQRDSRRSLQISINY